MARLGAEKPVGGDELAAVIAERASGKSRLLVAIAGPPGAGKSTISNLLAARLNAQGAGPAVVVPMDGFHFDNAVLEQRKLLARKGAPETFDVAGFTALLLRLSQPGDVAIPLFDRKLDLARAGAAIVSDSHRILLVEGNYLLLKDGPWAGIKKHFDLTVRLEVAESELESRLVQRWLDHGYDANGARARAMSNDIPNARLVITRSRPADFVVQS